ncbi:MAG TPA: hypothetical protein VFS33_01110 [Gemmatimonadales bacterium]|nr:hypothetical protein [Gemmatimonadales bacterium]
MLARVQVAGAEVDRRAPAPELNQSRRKTDITQSAEQVRELRSLRWVFREMGASYREYRQRTGAPVSPAVRHAADRFKREQNVPALVSLAGHLDELEILSW